MANEYDCKSDGLAWVSLNLEAANTLVNDFSNALCPPVRNSACCHQLMQYLRSRLRYSTISTNHIDKLIFQPAQINIHLH